MNFNIEDIIIISSILVSKSLYYETFGQNKLLILFLILFGIFVLYKSYKHELSFSKSNILLYLLIILAIFINPNAVMSTSLVFLTGITIALLFTATIPFSHFVSTFYKLMKLLMFFSLFRYLFILTRIYSPLSDFVSIIGAHYQNFVFFGVIKSGYIYFQLLRNNGLWWEPGAFQVFINLSFLLGLVFKRISKKDYLLFLVVILSTFSTAGIIIFSILSYIYFRRKINYKLIFLFLLISFPIISLSSYYQIVIKNKMNLANPSAHSRYNDAMLAIRMFKDYPIIGTGFGNLKIQAKYEAKYSYGTGSNGELLLLANMGLLSFIIFIPFIFPNYFKGLGKIERLLGSITLFLIFSPENFTIMLIFPLLIFYGAIHFKLDDFQQEFLGTEY